MLQHSKSGLVPVLVDQFNDIIETKATILQKEVESFVAQKAATAKVLPMLSETRRFSATDVDLFSNQLQKSSSAAEINNTNFCDLNITNVNKSAFPKLKRSKSQKCFTKKLNHARMNAIKNTITENTENTESKLLNVKELETIADRIARIKSEYQITTSKPKTESVRVVTFADSPIEKNEVQPVLKSSSPLPTLHRSINHQQMMEDLAELKLSSFSLTPEPTDLLLCDNGKLSRSPSPVPFKTAESDKSKPFEKETIRPAKVMPTYNVLLEKLQNIYR